MTYTFYDAAYPPANPPQADGCAGYIGGDTPHVWTADEWASQPSSLRLPVFVRSNPPGPGAAADVNAAVAQLKALKAPLGCLVAWDMETSADPSYISQVYTLLWNAGYALIVYGTESDVEGNRNPDGYYWGADWTNTPHLHPGDVITQWESLPNVDEEQSNVNLPFWNKTQSRVTVQNGCISPAVELVQTRLGAWNVAMTVDGNFGAATETAVKAFQELHRLTVDGIVGPATWGALEGAPPPPKPPAPKPVEFAAPVGLAAARAVTVGLSWRPVPAMEGHTPTGYTVAVYTGETLVGTKVVTGTATTVVLALQGVYQIHVWANGGEVAPPHATLSVTV
jgi:hypothetical protein